jgi:hypothetical protein
LAVGPAKRVVDGKHQIALLPIQGLWRLHADLAVSGQGNLDRDLVRFTHPVMRVGRLDSDTAGRDAPETVFQLLNIVPDDFPQMRGRFNPFDLKSQRRFHRILHENQKLRPPGFATLMSRKNICRWER